LARWPFWGTFYQTGSYTRTGPAEELVRKTDDALAVIGGGEEIHLEFASPSQLSAGWTRRYVLDARGWAKDMDFYTRDGDTLGPLPTARSASRVRDELHARLNKLFQTGRLEAGRLEDGRGLSMRQPLPVLLKKARGYR